MSLVILPEPGSHLRLESGGQGPGVDEFWDSFPTLSRRRVRLIRRLAMLHETGRLWFALGWLQDWLGVPANLGAPDIYDRAAGLRRGGLVAQLSLPSLGTRIGVGVEIPLAHAVVDRLLGFDRSFAESRLQLSPVEWGIWMFVFVKALDQLKAGFDTSHDRPEAGPISWLDIALDRVGPDPFDVDHLGKITTVSWTSTLGAVSGTVRLWLPDLIVDRWLRSKPATAKAANPERWKHLIASRPSVQVGAAAGPTRPVGPPELSSDWRARGGMVRLPRGMKGLRVGGVLPILDENPTDPAHDPDGRVELVLDLNDDEGRFAISTRTLGQPGGRFQAVTSTVRLDPPPPRETSEMGSNPPPDAARAATPSAGSPSSQPPNLPVTLTVELGRINLTLSRLADLKPGDVLELSRHNREPVELTSNGRLVARGELVKIDTELGVRVTTVFL